MVQYLLSNLCLSEVIDVGIGPPKGVMSLQHRELWGRGFWTFIHNIKIYKEGSTVKRVMQPGLMVRASQLPAHSPLGWLNPRDKKL